MIIALTGPRKNIGDYLIAHRGIALLREFVDPDVLEVNRFSDFSDSLSKVNEARSIYLCGGPAYTRSVYPAVYKLVPDLADIKPRIFPFGLGWCGRPAGKPEDFRFDDLALDFLSKIHGKIRYSSARDPLTESILKHHGFNNVLMTGCPVWYHLDSLGTKFAPPNEIRKIVFTTPDNPRMLFQVARCFGLLRKLYPESEIVSAFHRGISADALTSTKASLGYRAMVASGMLYGVKSVDVAYDLDKIEFYEDCDLHVGYRVHAHLHFLSRKQPSVLLCEDGRGVGMLQGLASEPIKAWEPGAIDLLEGRLRSEIENGWQGVASSCVAIEDTFPVMRSFLTQQ